MKLLLDTNVLIDYFTRRQPYFDCWKQVLAMQYFGDAELWASAKSFTDVFYVAKKPIGSKALQAAFVESLSFINVCSIGKEDIEYAAAEPWDDFEDRLVDIAAQKVKADAILTRDKKGFVLSTIPSIAPDELPEWVKNAYGLSYEEIDF